MSPSWSEMPAESSSLAQKRSPLPANEIRMGENSCAARMERCRTSVALGVPASAHPRACAAAGDWVIDLVGTLRAAGILIEREEQDSFGEARGGIGFGRMRLGESAKVSGLAGTIPFVRV